MIISFNPSIFQTQDDYIQDTLAKILIALMDTNIHFIDAKSLKDIFYDGNGSYTFDSNLISQRYLSPRHQISLRDFLSRKSRVNITTLHKQHLVHIVVGIDVSNKEFHPESVYRIIKERSKIILENGINDWKFVQGICQKYSGSRTKRRSIYQLIDQAMKTGIIESENCGGIGELKKVTQRWIDEDRYKNIFLYKLMAIFDSDRKTSDELTRHKNQVEYFKKRNIDTNTDCKYEHTDLILWHILYKRKIENYMPLDVLLKHITSITQAQKNNLITKTYKELDFLEYDHNNIEIGKSPIKNKFPEMLLNDVSYHDFEKRCEHHKIFLEEAKECVSEIEQILLKIAKIL